jgi:hypothetical protein
MYVHSPLEDNSKCPCIGVIYRRVDADRALGDAMYCQVMRVVFQAPTPPIMVRGLHILLLLTTFFAPSSPLRDAVASFLVGLLRQQGVPAGIARAAYICLFRLEAVCSASELCYHFHKRDPREIDQIWTHSTEARILYWGVSLWEIYMKQQQKAPGSVVPSVVQDLGKALLDMGAEATEGIFRLPGSSAKVEEIIARAESALDFTAGYSIHDLASAFKNWYRDVPGGIVGAAEVPALMEAAKAEGEGKEFVTLASRLPPLNRFALMYLIGFLRRIQASASTTKMTVDNLSMVFAPNVVRMDGDPMSISTQTSAAKMFIATLIGHWDVSMVYSDTSGDN